LTKIKLTSCKKLQKCQNTLQIESKNKNQPKKPLETPQDKASNPSKNDGDSKNNESP
jgi:hypothetical protein